MDRTKNIEKDKCGQSKVALNGYAKEYIGFVKERLDNEDFEEALENLLPFDKWIQSKMEIADETTALKSMGLCIMRMDFIPPLFSLGISTEVAEGAASETNNSVFLITACRTLQELRDFVRTERFAGIVRERCETYVDNWYSEKGVTEEDDF